jgi:hypothetical protein
MTPSALDRLETLADEATPGPWKYIPDDERDDWQLVNDEAVWIKQDDSGVPILKADGEYIAAANPTTIKTLIQVIREAREGLGHYSVKRTDKVTTCQSCRTATITHTDTEPAQCALAKIDAMLGEIKIQMEEKK